MSIGSDAAPAANDAGRYTQQQHLRGRACLFFDSYLDVGADADVVCGGRLPQQKETKDDGKLEQSPGCLRLLHYSDERICKTLQSCLSGTLMDSYVAFLYSLWLIFSCNYCISIVNSVTKSNLKRLLQFWKVTECCLWIACF